MTEKPKNRDRQPSLFIDSEVVRQIRQHARSSTKAEICGVLIGQDRDGVIKVEASITGVNAEEAGAHVTFTQDTWEYIYQIKDKKFPNERIVGWYHSHPGFGVFLSEHDTFIHKNFFSSPGQVAWVFDPHSDEEGCFGWVGGKIERLTQISVTDRRGGERAEATSRPEPSLAAVPDSDDTAESWKTSPSRESASDEPDDDSSLQRLVAGFFSHLTLLLLGFLLSWYFFPRLVPVPIPVDPRTGQQIGPPGSFIPSPSMPSSNSANPGLADPHSSDQNGTKGDHAQSK